MILTELTPPAEEPVSLATLKDHLRVDTGDDDALIAQMALAARQHIETLLDLALVSRNWRLTFDDWPELPVELVRGPVTAVLSVEVLDEAEVWQALPAEDYLFFGRTPGLVEVTGLKPLPAVDREGIRIDFTAGFGAAADVLSPLVQAVSLLTAHYYERREPFENDRITRVPETVGALIAPYRRVRL